MDNQELLNNNANVAVPEIVIDNNKQVADLSSEQFLQTAEQNGYVNATKDPVLRAFTVFYNPQSNDFAVAADLLKAGSSPQGVSKDDYKQNILLSLINYGNGMENKTELQQNALNGLITYQNNLQNPQVRQEAQPEIQAEDPNLIELYNPGRRVEGLNWDEFAQKFEANGWANAKNDNTVRSLFNLCDGVEGHEAILEAAKMVLTLQQPNQNAKADYEVMIQNAVRDAILLKAQRHENFAYNEVQRPSILHFQGLLNAAGEHFDFNQDQPNLDEMANELNNADNNNEIHNENNEVQNENNGPVVDNNIVNNENPLHQEVPQENQHQEEVQQEQNNIEQPQNNIEQPQPAVQENKRPVMSTSQIVSRTTRVATSLKNNTLTLRGSDEYKNAREEFLKVQKDFNKVLGDAGGQIKNFSEADTRRLINELTNVLYLDDKYIGKKIKDKDNSENAKKRIRSVKDSFNILEEQIYALTARLDEICEEPAQSLENLSNGFDSANKAIDKAKLILRGSEQFDEAANDFEKINKRIQDLKKKYAGKEDQITVGELDDIRGQILYTQNSISKYLNMKTGETISENTHNRTAAMESAQNFLAQAMRRCNQLEDAKKKAPAKDINVLSGDSAKNYLAIEDAEKNVHFGSTEYKNAKTGFKSFNDKLTELSDPNHTISVKELEEFNRLMDQTEEDIDKYLHSKFDKESGEKTQKRVDAMRQAKETIIEARKKCEALTKERRAQYQNVTTETLQEEETAISTDLTIAKTHVNNNKVWFGGSDYNEALAAYEKVTGNEITRDSARATKAPSKNSLQEEVKELKEARAKALVYIDRKEKEIRELKEKGKELDYKGKHRLATMNRALDALNRRIDIAEAKLETMGVNEKTETEKKMKEFINAKDRAIPGKEGLDKIVAMCESTAARNLEALSKKTVYSNDTRDSVRFNAATLFLAQSLRDGSFKVPISGTLEAFSKVVNQLANSPEFIQAMPKEKMDPKMCRSLLTDPKTMKQIATSFNENMKKNANKSQIKELVNEKKLQEAVNKKEEPAKNQPHV